MTLPLCAEGGWGWTKPSWAHRAGGSRDGHSSTYSRVCGAPGPAVGLPPPCRTHLVLQQRRQRLEVVAGHLLLLLIKPILRSAHGLHSARGGSRGFASSAPPRTQSTAPAVAHPHARLRAACGLPPAATPAAPRSPARFNPFSSRRGPAAGRPLPLPSARCRRPPKPSAGAVLPWQRGPPPPHCGGSRPSCGGARLALRPAATRDDTGHRPPMPASPPEPRAPRLRRALGDRAAALRWALRGAPAAVPAAAARGERVPGPVPGRRAKGRGGSVAWRPGCLQPVWPWSCLGRAVSSPHGRAEGPACPPCLASPPHRLLNKWDFSN